MNSVLQDIRFSLRLMRKRPGMTSLVIGALVLGIGLNTAIFSVVDAVLVRPLPLVQPDRIVWLQGKNIRTDSPITTSYPDFLDWKAQNHSFDELSAMHPVSLTLTGSGPPEILKAMGISASGFRVWGVTTVFGRGFTDAEDQPGAPRAVVLNHPFWQRKFGGDPAILGKTVTLDGQAYTVVGIVPQTPVKLINNPDVYVADGPLVNPHIMERDTWWFYVYGRLKQGVTMPQAQAEMDTVTSRLRAQYPDTNKDMGVTLRSLAEDLSSNGRQPLLLLMLASSLIFLLAAVNVMTVSIAQTAERSQELSIRLALGANRSSLVRQLFIQASISAVAGSLLGLVLAEVGLKFFLHHFPDVILRFQETTINLSVISLTVAMAFATTLIATFLPAIHTLKVRVSTELRGEWSSFAPSRYRALGRIALILFEVALASGLTLVSGLLIKSFYEVNRIDLGFEPSNLFTFHISPPLPRYKEPEKQSALYKAAAAKLSEFPGMQLVSGSSGLPLTPHGWLNNLEPDPQSPASGQQIMVEDESILPGFFQAMQLPLLRGREFTEADREGAPPVIIVDDQLASKLWPKQAPLGQHVHMAPIRGGPTRSLEVAGVVREVKHFGGIEAATRWMQVYVPQAQDATSDLSFVVNTTISEADAKNAAEKALYQLDPDLPVEDFKTMDGYLDGYLSRRKLGLILLSSFATIGIVLGMIGIYGVVANAVTQRRREIAIRMALGATHSGTMIVITRMGLLATLAGICIGAAIVMSLARVLASLLYGVTALDPMTYAVSALVLILLALVASVIPGARLFRFNIQEILRQ